MKRGDDENAVKFFNKSLSEHRSQEVTKLIAQVSAWLPGPVAQLSSWLLGLQNS